MIFDFILSVFAGYREYKSVGIEIRARFKGVWWQLLAYALPLDDVKKNLTSIEKG